MLAWILSLAALQVSGPAAAPEAQVLETLEELRKGEMLLDAEYLEPLVAYSMTLVEGCRRVSGRAAFIEPFKSLRASGAVVTRLTFRDITARVYGASAVVTYRYVRQVKGGPQPGTSEGFATDVFEKREDGAWILVHRHRVSPCPQGSAR
ncbi:MAG: nuclear transport factor 2 family protein [Thermoanaerobaculum sp.]